MALNRSPRQQESHSSARCSGVFRATASLAIIASKRRSGSTPQHEVERKDGKTGSRRALRARAGSRRGRRGRPVLQEPVLGAADNERRNCPGVRGVLSQVPEASMSAAAAMQASNASGKVQARYRRPPDLSGSTLQRHDSSRPYRADVSIPRIGARNRSIPRSRSLRNRTGTACRSGTRKDNCCVMRNSHIRRSRGPRRARGEVSGCYTKFTSIAA